MRSGSRRILAIALHAVLVVFGTFHHEMWRDEHQAWLVARDAGSLGEVIANLAYDGHPALWHSLLFMLTRLTHDPVAMQLLHVVLAIAVGALLVLAAPFPARVRYLLPFGYLLLFEYGMISRSYALSVLLTFGYCAWETACSAPPLVTLPPDGSGRRSSTLGRSRGLGELVPWVLLALLANTNAFGMLVSLGLAAGRLVESVIHREADRSPRKFRVRGRLPFAVGVLVFVAGVLFSWSCILPNEGSTFPVTRPAGSFDWDRFRNLVAQVGGAYVYIPKPEGHFWNTYLLPAGARILLGIVVVAGSAFALRRRPVALVSFLSGTLLLAGAQYWTGLGWVRYSGFHAILLIACAWIGLSEEERPPGGFGARSRSGSSRADVHSRSGSNRADVHSRSESSRADVHSRSGSSRAGAHPGGPSSRKSGTGGIVSIAAFALVILHVTSGLFAWIQDLRLPFSSSAAAAEVLRDSLGPKLVRELSDPGVPLIGATDFIVSPLTSLLDTRMFYIERAEYGSFVIWDARRKPEYTFDDLRSAVQTAMNDGHREEGILVVSIQPRFQQNGVVRPLESTMLDADLRIDLVHSVPPGIVEEEQYFIYAVRRASR